MDSPKVIFFFGKKASTDEEVKRKTEPGYLAEPGPSAGGCVRLAVQTSGVFALRGGWVYHRALMGN